MPPSDKLFMYAVFKDIELLEEMSFSKNDVVCTVFLNDNCVDKLYLDQDSHINLCCTDMEDRIRFLFRIKQTGAIIGSISFTAKNFFSIPNNNFSQWYHFSFVFF